jgi:hypothetical protein
MYSSIKSIIKVILIGFLVVLGPFSYCQTLKPLRQTTGLGGQTSQMIVNNRRLVVQQSIGQGSVIGTFSSGSHKLRQGFIQPSNQPSLFPGKDDLSKLNAAVFPNPFSSRITIEIADVVNGSILVSMHDVTGRMVFLNEFPASQILEIDAASLRSGIYIIKVTSQSKFFSSKLVKR